MPFNLIWDDRGVIVQHEGVVDIFEINQVNQDLYSDERFDRLQYQVINLLPGDFSGVSLKQMEQPAAIDKAASHSVHSMNVALVVADPHAVLLCDQYIEQSKEFHSSWKFERFKTFEAAISWAKES